MLYTNINKRSIIYYYILVLSKLFGIVIYPKARSPLHNSG